jgi:flagellar assembly protein FliH
MSADHKSILRSGGAKTVEDFDLPKWDRQGNLVAKPVKKKPTIATKIEDIKEEVVKVPTAKEIEAIREEAYNEGFEQGYQNGLGQGQREGLVKGQKEGLEKGQEEGLLKGVETGRAQALTEERTKTDEKLAVLTEVSTALKSQIESERDELEKALTALAIRIARQTLQDELRLKPSHISNVVHAAIQCLPNPDEKLTLLLNPEEVDFVETFADSHWQLQADDSVTVGGCKIKSAYSYVDYTLEHRFENAVSHLLSTIPDVNSEKVKQPLSEEFLTHTQDEHLKSSVDLEKDEEALNVDINDANPNIESTKREPEILKVQEPNVEADVKIEQNSEPDFQKPKELNERHQQDQPSQQVESLATVESLEAEENPDDYQTDLSEKNSEIKHQVRAGEVELNRLNSSDVSTESVSMTKEDSDVLHTDNHTDIHATSESQNKNPELHPPLSETQADTLNSEDENRHEQNPPE